MKERILFVDDEPLLLQTYQRLLNREYAVEIVDTPAGALEKIAREGPYAVIVADLLMPQMDGINFLIKSKEISPMSVRLMLTGHAHLEAAINAVNEGHIFRFLSKPCPVTQLTRTLDAAIAQYRLVLGEKELLEKTLAGSVKVLTDVLALINPSAFGRAARIRRYVRHMARQLKLPDLWQYELAGLLSQIGCIVLPAETLAKFWSGQPCTVEEQAHYDSHPTVARDLLLNIPRLEPVARMIALQHVQGAPPTSRGGRSEDPVIVLGGQLLQVAVALEQAMTPGRTVTQGLQQLRQQGSRHPANLLDALDSLELGQEPPATRMVRVSQLETSMILDQDVRSRTGLLLMPRGSEVTSPLIMLLRGFTAGGGVEEPIRVLVSTEPAQRQAA